MYIINQIGVFLLFTQFWIQSGLICILCQSYLPWRELNSILIWSHIHIFHIFRCTCSTFNELGTPKLPKALSRFVAMLSRLFIPIPSGSVVGSKESALLVLPFLRELGCPLLVRAHQQPRGIRGIHVRGEKTCSHSWNSSRCIRGGWEKSGEINHAHTLHIQCSKDSETM